MPKEKGEKKTNNGILIDKIEASGNTALFDFSNGKTRVNCIKGKGVIQTNGLKLSVLSGNDSELYEENGKFNVIGGESGGDFKINSVTIKMQKDGTWEIHTDKSIMVVQKTFGYYRTRTIPVLQLSDEIILYSNSKEFHFSKKGEPLIIPILVFTGK